MNERDYCEIHLLREKFVLRLLSTIVHRKSNFPSLHWKIDAIENYRYIIQLYYFRSDDYKLPYLLLISIAIDSKMAAPVIIPASGRHTATVSFNTSHKRVYFQVCLNAPVVFPKFQLIFLHGLGDTGYVTKHHWCVFRSKSSFNL